MKLVRLRDCTIKSVYKTGSTLFLKLQTSQISIYPYSTSDNKVNLVGFLNPLDGDPPSNNELGLIEKIPNKNRRNLEYLGIAKRQKGWKFQAPNRDYQHKLVLEQSGRYVTGYVEHKTGKRVVWASSQETSLVKRLYSLQDVTAVKSVGSILARRCLKAGHPTPHVPPSANTTNKVVKNSQKEPKTTN